MARSEAAATITRSTIIIDDIVAALMFGCVTQLSKDNGVYHDGLTTDQFQVYSLGFSVDNIYHKEYLVRDSNPQNAISLAYHFPRDSNPECAIS